MDATLRAHLTDLLEHLAGEQVPTGADRRPVAGPPAGHPVGHPALRIYPEARTVLLGADEIRLTRREFDLLHCFASYPRQVFTRDQLLDRVCGHRRSGPRSIDVHIRRLRVKLGDDLPVVRTVHGVGYRLDGALPVTVARLAGADGAIGGHIGDSRVTWRFD
ncbi:winged helix-turn-helix domain-containing protein [Micromonospora sp. LOL_014]|uniref:winged helix-turn-helix domain-containing protein n=1 Tax=Micromonospora sp. LOL_014 TaxID=3345415 RepID=UPI003A8A7088